MRDYEKLFMHGNNAVRRANLKPLVREAKKRGISTGFVASVKKKKQEKGGTIYVAAHIKSLIFPGVYKVHFDHGLKGKGTANIEKSISDYKSYNYLPLIDLHITAGEVGQERTKMLLGPNSNRAVIGGYPKADDLIKLNTKENKIAVFKELGFDINKPLITYAPAGEESYDKPGGSLSNVVMEKLKEISKKHDYNILIKLKYARTSLPLQLLHNFKRLLTRITF